MSDWFRFPVEENGEADSPDKKQNNEVFGRVASLAETE
jgi:hypothetical protein